MPWYTTIPARATGWTKKVIDATSFKPSPEVVVLDLRVSIVFVIVRLGVLLYVILYATVLSHTYAEEEAVESHASLVIGLGSTPPSSDASYCNNPAYDAFIGAPPTAFAGVFFGPNITCRPFDRTLHTSLPTSGVATLATTLLFLLPNRTPALATRFTVGAEASTVTLVHQYRTPSGFFSGINPRTLFRGADGSVIGDYPAGSPILNLPLSTWLAAAGASLDSKNPIPPNPPSVWPFYRNTGMVLLVRVAYSNLRNGEWPTLGGDDVRADVTVTLLAGQLATTDGQQVADPEFGDAVLVRSGVRLEVAGSGTLRHTTLIAVVFAIVQIAVLIGVGDVLTSHFARCIYRGRQSYESVTTRVYTPAADAEVRSALDLEAEGGILPIVGSPGREDKTGATAGAAV